MKKKDFYKTMERICPPELALEWDNCGIQIDSESLEVERVLVALEITDDVIDEAVEKKADVIVNLKRLNEKSALKEICNVLGELQ